jgi:hypothetical protein
MNDSLHLQLNRVQKIALIVAVVGVVFSAIGWGCDRHDFFVSYLVSYTFWIGLSLGCLGIAMIHHLTGGRWGFVTRRFMEAGFLTLPLMTVLFVPLLFGLRNLYSWARPEAVAASVILQKKQMYLNHTGFVVRAIFFFIVWNLIAFLLRKWSLQQDTSSDVTPTVRLRTLGGPGIVIYPLTATFAFVDWVMSVEADWYSTMFPLVILIGQVLTAFAFITILLAWVREQTPFRDVVTADHFHDLGNLLLAFVVFWTYVSFGQLLVIYSGNLPHEIEWYLHRIAGSWKWLILFIAAFYFFVPFFLLLFRSVKRRVTRLVRVAILVFVMQAFAIFWTIVPVFRPDGLRIAWTDFTVFFGMGGLWLAMCIAVLKRQRVLPQNDPRIEFSIPVTANAK